MVASYDLSMAEPQRTDKGFSRIGLWGHETKASAVASALRQEILSGQLPPGTPVQQNEIAQRLAVSSTPVREAFGILQAEGLLVLRPHHGVTVAPSRPVRVDEAAAIYEIRHVLERLALRRVLEGSEPDVARGLVQVVSMGVEAFENRDFVAFRYSLSEFHRLLSKGLGSTLLMSSIRPLNSQAQFFATGLDHEGLRASHRAHEQIVQAIGEGDLERALTLEEEHHFENLSRLTEASLDARQDVASE